MCWKKYKVYRAILFYPIFAVQPIMAQTDSLFLTVEQLFEKGVQHNFQLQADIMKESMARERAKTARAAQFPELQRGSCGAACCLGAWIVRSDVSRCSGLVTKLYN